MVTQDWDSVFKVRLQRRLLFFYSLMFALIVPIVASLALESQTQILPHHRRIKIASSAAKSERRKNERRAIARIVCPRCSRPSSICVCKGLPSDWEKIAVGIHVLVLQHPNEHRKKNISTVPLMPLVLKHFSKKVGYTFDADILADFKDILVGGQKPLLLFPGPNALSLDNVDKKQLPFEDHHQVNSNVKESSETPSRLLILFDGTWSETKRMARDSPSIVNACQQIQFTSPTDRCVYDSLRKEPERHCLSTLESCCQALLLLESQEDNTQRAVHYLTSTLRILVDHQTRLAKNNKPRELSMNVKNEKNRRVFEIEEEIFCSDGLMSSYDEDAIVLEDGSILRKLFQSDAQSVNKQWKGRSLKSLSLVHRRIELGQACFGVFMPLKSKYVKGSVLCGSVLQNEDGSLGKLYVKEEYRRRGYASALVDRATRELGKNNIDGVTYILDGNAASEAVFSKCGWVREDAGIKKQTGKRRSKRKWIYPIDEKTNDI